MYIYATSSDCAAVSTVMYVHSASVQTSENTDSCLCICLFVLSICLFVYLIIWDRVLRIRQGSTRGFHLVAYRLVHRCILSVYGLGASIYLWAAHQLPHWYISCRTCLHTRHWRNSSNSAASDWTPEEESGCSACRTLYCQSKNRLSDCCHRQHTTIPMIQQYS